MKHSKGIDIGLLITRIAVGLLMLPHGIAKISKGVGGISEELIEHGIPGFIAYGVYIGEIVAPLLLLVGYRTRLAAAVFLINMLVIIFIFHPDDLTEFTKHGGWKLELAGLFLLGSLSLLFTGGGKYALSANSQWD